MNKIISIVLLLVFTFSQAKPEPEKKHRVQLKLIDSFLAHHHYQRAVLDDKKSKEVLDNYLEYLDFGKILLMQKDITNFKRYETLLDDFAHKGELDEVYSIHNKTITRTQAFAKWALQRLDKPISNDEKGTIDLDREKMDWAKDEKELQYRWNKELINKWVILRLEDKSDLKARVRALG